MNQATGTFDVDLTPQSEGSGVGDEGMSRLSIDKRFYGDLHGTSRGQMLAAGTPTEGSAAYVAIERVSGTLAGRNGTFVLQHSGIMNRGAPQLAITIVPDSGTEELAGIAGRMTIAIADGEHSYELSWTLGAAD